eukprot:3987156-Alexandrium_andersonii.AAC.1
MSYACPAALPWLKSLHWAARISLVGNMDRGKEFQEVEAGECLCVRGGLKAGWTVVQTFDSAGQTAFGVSNKEPWLLDH